MGTRAKERREVDSRAIDRFPPSPPSPPFPPSLPYRASALTLRTSRSPEGIRDRVSNRFEDSMYRYPEL